MAAIDNEIYNTPGDIWWQPDTVLYLLKTSMNPPRVSYFRRVLLDEMKIRPAGKRALEVGCGGGILCEEIARMGFDTTGVDPSASSLETARHHATASGLQIQYEAGTAERLPYADASVDVLFCCDVLEHVHDVHATIAEFARVLKPGGVFCYDTLNRTFVSWLIAIKVWQDWTRYAFMPRNLHVWRMFIKPQELTALLSENGFEPGEPRGMSAHMSPLRMLSLLRARAKGEMTYAELGAHLQLRESADLKISYMGVGTRLAMAQSEVLR
ncbi:MAG TPA: bifunctional 2-polyprenyl-6-hydroxyphenol methylase/3-demethylubiquinol 3-O-methyltransferase UbiG [Vicinamibacterales bacterium]|jgi:2-polyprenyl-6-hydroxyphenyl methylase/3-demethylubiquinone-9 3-methyltransferase|nr:bifunctional 2-polyprenyl-6-hydroxyphenol methylase/3-demethylubiquinol 3-O-methyltransferase UbiG [Vicinamibacterales bacterium]